jgi:MipA family protein
MKSEVNMHIRRWFMFALIILVISFPQSAICEEKPLWEIGIGGAVLVMPDYRGSDEYKCYPLPYPYFVYRGIITADEHGLSGQIFKTDRIILDISANGSVPVKNNTARQGMPDLDTTFELGPALNIIILSSKQDQYNLNVSLPVRAVFSTNFTSVSREGWVFSPRINFEKGNIIPQTGINLGISAGPVFADSGYHTYYYTVEDAYATAWRPAYSAGGGYSGSRLTVGLDKSYKDFIFSAFVSTDFLKGAVFEDSPLVKRQTSFMGGVSVSWIFLKSEKKVETGK